MRPPVRRVVLAVAAALPSLGMAQTPTYLHHVYLDTDNNPKTGCSVAVCELGWNGTIAGVEQALTVEVTWGQIPMVTGVSRSLCTSGQVAWVRRMRSQRAAGRWAWASGWVAA